MSESDKVFRPRKLVGPGSSNNTILSKYLYIHIPKTGGASIEQYFMKKYNLHYSLLCSKEQYDLTISKCSKQHYPLSLKLRNATRLGIQHNSSTKIFSSVRNPYTRLISDLYFYKLINSSTTKTTTENVVQSYLRKYKNDHEAYDNHAKPQYLFLINDNGVIDPRIKIIKQESLSSGMHSLGFTDFNRIVDTIDAHFTNTNNHKTNYYKHINMNIVNMINTVYREDFRRFGYTMITNEKELHALQGI